MMNKTELLALGFEVIEDESMYKSTMEELFEDIFKDWADVLWMVKVDRRTLDKFSNEFVRSVFGNYDVLGYYGIVTPNRKVAFLNREHYYMESESDDCVLAILGLYEEKLFGEKKSSKSKFDLFPNI